MSSGARYFKGLYFSVLIQKEPVYIQIFLRNQAQCQSIFRGEPKHLDVVTPHSTPGGGKSQLTTDPLSTTDVNNDNELVFDNRLHVNNKRDMRTSTVRKNSRSRPTKNIGLHPEVERIEIVRHTFESCSSLQDNVITERSLQSLRPRTNIRVSIVEQ